MKETIVDFSSLRYEWTNEFPLINGEIQIGSEKYELKNIDCEGELHVNLALIAEDIKEDFNSELYIDDISDKLDEILCDHTERMFQATLPRTYTINL